MVANLPVIDDQLAFRIAGSYKDKGGWIDRVNDNANDINDTNYPMFVSVDYGKPRMSSQSRRWLSSIETILGQ